jgi:hypothetical protein
MEFLMFLGLAILGGGVMAVAIRTLGIRLPQSPAQDGAQEHRTLSPDAINLSSIQVAGVGGLGLVAVSLGVALSMPAVGVPIAAGVVAGAFMAILLIRRRRRQGILPSSTKGPGAKTILVAGRDGETPLAREDDAAPGRANRLLHVAG